jgi:hypothetical protein
VVLGRNLAGLVTRVRIGDIVTTIPVPRYRTIELTVPGTLTSGTQTVQVVHDLPLDAETGQPPVPHRGFESNVVPLLVRPVFQGILPANASAGDTVQVTVDPPVAADQSRTLLVGDTEIAGQPVAFDSVPSAIVDFRLPIGADAVSPGTYLVRVRVDGAESRLTIDGAGNYDGPTFTVDP